MLTKYNGNFKRIKHRRRDRFLTSFDTLPRYHICNAIASMDCMYMYVCMYVCMYVYIYIYTHIYIRTEKYFNS